MLGSIAYVFQLLNKNKAVTINLIYLLEINVDDIMLPSIQNSGGSPLQKRMAANYAKLRPWAMRSRTNCFRLYDKEIGVYPVAIDYYAGRFCVHYFSKRRGFEEPEQALIDTVDEALASLFGASKEDIFYRFRAKDKGESRQYEKLSSTKAFFNVTEYGALFEVNMADYLDTGLFLDHRETRKLVAKASKGKRLLNLFAYTCSFSVHAALHGAAYTKSVDMSNTYCAWGRRNFDLNGITKDSHPIIRDDCLKFLDHEIRFKERYDVIVIDPPTISRSKKMSQLFDVKIDYVSLISKALQLLKPNGTLFFSCNARKFELETTLFPGYAIAEITDQTIPIDFHDRCIHRCWKFEGRTLSGS